MRENAKLREANQKLRMNEDLLYHVRVSYILFFTFYDSDELELRMKTKIFYSLIETLAPITLHKLGQTQSISRKNS